MWMDLLKEHLTHTKGNTKGCPNVTNEIQKKVLDSMKEKTKKNVQRTSKKLLMNPNEFDDDVDWDRVVKEQDRLLHDSGVGTRDHETAEVTTLRQSQTPGAGGTNRKRKAARSVQGPLDTMLKPNYENIKQTTVDRNNPHKEKLRKLAWRKIYEVELPFNVVQVYSLQEFKKSFMQLETIGKVCRPRVTMTCGNLLKYWKIQRIL